MSVCRRETIAATSAPRLTSSTATSSYSTDRASQPVSEERGTAMTAIAKMTPMPRSEQAEQLNLEYSVTAAVTTAVAAAVVVVVA